ncbi:putative beta-galactosidase b [Phaeomoniella chlamydospora]|uniref:beta-galactosidase n=1 Tax=Phaeomoniella chlamydospora TaxID=158046 RepID=A0A0G2F2C0_PHACM|nr:putative beta-galactosidase b [Phaeomoniella chlamydospora]
MRFWKLAAERVRDTVFETGFNFSVCVIVITYLDTLVKYLLHLVSSALQPKREGLFTYNAKSAFAVVHKVKELSTLCAWLDGPFLYFMDAPNQEQSRLDSAFSPVTPGSAVMTCLRFVPLVQFNDIMSIDYFGQSVIAFYRLHRNMCIQNDPQILRMVTTWKWACCALIAWLSTTAPVTNAQNSSAAQWPLHDDGYSDVVQWDHFSFEVNGKRAFLFAGEMHYWRVPVPELWGDILQKIKAAGCNAFTFYAHWGYHAPNPNTLDFSNGAHNYTRLLELAKEIGLYVFVRTGPYINAEANAGGFPLWLTTGAYGTLRNNDTRYTAAWEPYQSESARLTVPHQITEGGNALANQIENEYGYQWTDATAKTPNYTGIAYMELLEQNARSNGITIPLYHNNPNLNSKSWSKDYGAGVGGDVDVYGVDSYPACWSCNLAECTSTNGAYVAFQVVKYYDHFQSVAPSQPEFMPEFQGGSYNPWGGPQGGCRNNSDETFANLYYRHNIAERVTAMSLYMFYGGTSWGWFAAPVVATSYDYSAPISEDRSIGSKYYETKNLALFTRVAEDLRMTNRLGNSTSYTTNSAILKTELKNPETNAGFYVTAHANSSSDTVESFKLHVSTTLGNLTIPQKATSIVLNGHQSKIIVTDFIVGSRSILYSTAEVLTYSIFDGQPTLVLWVPTDESGEFLVEGAKTGSVSTCGGCSNIRFYPEDSGLVVTFTQQAGSTVLLIDNELRVVILDRTYAYPFFAPTLSNDPLISANETVLVQGPYLVRGAEIEGSVIKITGDSNSATQIEVFAPNSVKSISWNGKALSTTQTHYGSLTSKIPGPSNFSVPQLGPWKVHDSLPEQFANYSDSGPAWVNANRTTTSSVYKPATYPVLYIDEYGFHNGIHLWRGYFNGSASGVFLNVQGGTAFGWSAYLNGNFIGSFLGSSSLEVGNLTLSFSNATINHLGENILLVIQDDSGHDETTGALNPRGITNATLISRNYSTTFTKWKVAGTAGGDTYSHTLDPIRSPINEGGLTAERLGWHLPSFDDSSWTASSPSTGFTSATVKFYRTTFPSIDIPTGHDVSLSFRLTTPSSGPLSFRALLFVNGYQYGRFNPYIGNQIDFPVPPGILSYASSDDYHDDDEQGNTVGLAVWAQSTEGAKINVELNAEYVLESGYEFNFGDTRVLRPGWTEERLKYA